MKDFEYYGLFLTEESKAKLIAWLWANDYYFNNDIIKGTLPEDWYLDHCTLLHWSQRANYLLLENSLDTMLAFKDNMNIDLEINGIGTSDKAMAFRCNLPNNLCANYTPHITICTYNGGKPVDSNYITDWSDIKPFVVETKLGKMY